MTAGQADESRFDIRIRRLMIMLTTRKAAKNRYAYLISPKTDLENAITM